MSSQRPSISCRSLTKQFGPVTAVDDLSFEVDAGSITGFVGANGAGKTTTMRMIVDLVKPTAGEALVDGRRYRDLVDPRREVGVVLDGPGSHPAHTARAHLRIIATAAGVSSKRVDEVLELVQLTEHSRRRVGAFSLGMRQRLALAAAMLGDPPVLILDEPANGLDPPGIMWMRELLRGFAAEGRAVLVSSHLLGELAEVAARMVIIDRGRLVADSTVDELVARQGRVVELQVRDPARVAHALRTRGARVDINGDDLVIEGSSAREVGDIVADLAAGPVYQLAERTARFEDAYFELAGTLTEQAPTANGHGGPA
jgi:ABC-2 type transport system ATP-binding protein